MSRLSKGGKKDRRPPQGAGGTDPAMQDKAMNSSPEAQTRSAEVDLKNAPELHRQHIPNSSGRRSKNR